MGISKLKTIGIHMLAGLLCLLVPMVCMAQDKGQDNPPAKGLQQRIDFGNAHILGQSIKSGAVYLMHRKKSDIRTMISVRTNYRKEIMAENGFKGTRKSEIGVNGVKND